MKILHTADWHLDEKKHDEIKKCLDFMVGKARKECPDLILISGDITNSRHLGLDTRSTRTIFNIVSSMLDIAPVAVVIGTPSHDGNAALALRECRGKYSILVSDRPEQFYYEKNYNNWCSIKEDLGDLFKPSFILTQIPQPTKQYFINEMAIEDSDKAISQAMDSILVSFGNLPDELKGIPHICNAHFQVGGAFISETQQLVGVDIEISKTQLKSLNANLVALGHIHKQQAMGDNIFYAGSPTRMNFGEKEDKGFYIHQIGETGLTVSEFIQTPARNMLEIKEDFTNDKTLSLRKVESILTIYDLEDLKDSDIKITLTVWQDEAKAINQTELKDCFYAAGCINVKLTPIRKPRETVRAEKVLAAENLPDKLEAMAELRGEKISNSILEKAKLIESGENEPWKTLDNNIIADN